jgi:NAD(P)-dependent dehydrogenase (short-subunit alcohol dehydrogenase family)
MSVLSLPTNIHLYITGANRGLGLELCKQLSEGGVYGSVYALCRKTSEELTQLAAKSDNVKIVENIEVTKDTAPGAVQEAFQTADAASLTPIHLLIHNAGAYGPPEDFAGSTADGYASQTLENITAERMRFAFELNTLAPLMLTQALVPNLEAAGSSDGPVTVAIISSAMGSIEENGSGGHYGYRAAKAGVNMVGMSLARDLKDKNIAVSLSKLLSVRTVMATTTRTRKLLAINLTSFLLLL